MATAEEPDPATSQPDLMNDPAYATNTEGKNKILDDPDTCRICRGEGSKEEPLFYPCKCSGSIKFVHQNCLMEWLSHSQKKHCELCKTPFRFTKLYDPQMPRTLPTPIFLRQVLIHGFRSLVTWSRFILVTFVWLGWLPWTMRAVWRGLFWLGDGGWADLPTVATESTLAAQHRLTELAANGTSPAGQGVLFSKEAAASALVSGMANIIPKILSPISQTLNLTAGEPTAYRIAKGFVFNSFGRLANPVILSTLHTAGNGTDGMNHNQRNPSWLSNVKMLKTLTRSQFLNNLLIDTLEGQLITLFVVIAFVLVFLIREWVVQQQPGINMGAGFNAEAAEREADAGGGLQQPARQIAQPRFERLRRVNNAEPVDDLGHPAGVVEGVGVLRPRVMARPRARRRIQAPPAEGQAQLDNHQQGLLEQDSRSLHTDGETAMFGDRLPDGEVFRFGGDPENEEQHAQQRPGMPTRNALGRAAEIRRTIDEQVRASGNQDWPGLQVFMDLWQRADSKPEQVLKIIADENRAAELGWIVSAMQRLQNVGDVSELPQTNASATVPETEGFEDERTSDGSSQSWQDVIRPSQSEGVTASTFSNDESELSALAENGRGNGEVISGDNSPEIKPSRASSTDTTEAPVNKGKGKLTDALTLISKAGPEENLTMDGVMTQYPESSKSCDQIAKIEPSNTGPATLDDDRARDHISEVSGSPEDLSSREFDSLGKPTESAEVPGRENLFGPDHTGRASPHERHNTFLVPDDHLPATREESRPRLPQEHYAVDDVASGSQGLKEKVMAWLWGGVALPEHEQEPRHEMVDENDEHVVQNIAEEAPFVPVIHGERAAQEVQGAENIAQDPEVAAAAAEAGLDPNDQDVIEEGEDLEGVMELIGMQGPLTGLFQNGMFSAVLVSTTVAAGIWLPYIWGKMVLLLLANPVSMMIRLPLRWLSSTADIIVDVCIFFIGCLIYWIDTGFRLCLVPVSMVFPSIARLAHHNTLATAARGVAEKGLKRLAKTVVATSSGFSENEFPVFSIVSHEALHALEAHIANSSRFCFYVVPKTLQGLLLQALHSSISTESLKSTLLVTVRQLPNLDLGKASSFVPYARSMVTMKSLSITLEYPRRTVPLDYSLAYWNTKDRFITILLGYAFFSVAGFVYLKISGSFAKAGSGEKVAGFVAEILQQAGGVVKVILIISIEMIVFPLYCGLLLDAALMPLFENVTIMSRVKFTLNSPSTSLFVHWFVGTCYMFHFALFVSMCRKIMRNGVLYFIRDPDDPTFHPVRDVLERNVSTQLRKIAFSALVYGALVIVCLGGVVWGLFYACEGVLPIHWSSNEPVLEFPVDLLFYNFLMPLAVKFFRPSDGLHSMYSWWFRRCARSLRLTHFLFGKRQEDEEGRHVRRTWWDLIAGKQGNVQRPVIGDDRRILAEDRNIDAYFLRDGTYVRAPASDQVRIPKGGKTFLEVNDDDQRVDGQPDRDDGLHGKKNDMFTKVYIPPLFRLRIGLFILLIWLFAAITGVGITIVPLVFGRMVFAYLLPHHVRMNDIYAFSIGVYILGGTLYSMLHFRTALSLAKSTQLFHTNSRNQALHKTYTYTLRFIRLFYTYVSFAMVLPSLSALIMEVYIIIPLHAYFGGGETHIIYFIQDWTLGVLYVKMAGRLILWYSASRPAQALRAVVRQGWLNPDVGLATRGFIFPASALMVAGLVLPLTLGWTANRTLFHDAGYVTQSYVYRYSYPAVLALCIWSVSVYLLSLILKGWKKRIKDEVYLIGERLHNFGEKRTSAVGTSSRVAAQD